MTMKEKYKILHLEDVQTDADIVKRELKRNNIEFEWLVVDSEADYVKALDDFVPDIVLSDHSLPGFGSFEALRILKAKKTNIPFIVITATLTEELAVSIVRQGADDYIMKDRLKRLPNAVMNAIQKYKYEKELKQVIDEAHEKEAFSNELLKKLSNKILLATSVAGIGIWEYLFKENKFIADVIFLKHFGLTLAEYNGNHEDLMKYVLPEDKATLTLLFADTTTNHSGGNIEFRVLWKDGSVRFLKAVAVMQWDNSGNASRLIGTTQDITSVKEAEQKINNSADALRHALNNLKKIMDSSLDVICAVDANGYFLQVSAASKTIWGYAPDEMIGKPVLDFVYPEDLEKTEKIAASIMAGNDVTNFENRYIRKDGSLIPISWSARFDRTDGIRYGVARNATEKQTVEKAVETERRRYADLFLHAPMSIGILKGPDHIVEMGNTAYLELIGKQNIIGKSIKELLPEVVGQKFIEILDKVYTTGEPFLASEKFVQLDRKGNGKMEDMYLNIVYQAYRKTIGSIDGVIFFTADVTEQILARKKIEESENQYRQIVETAQEGICMTDESNKIIFVNKKFCEILEYGEKEIIGKPFLSFKKKEDEKKAFQRIERRRQGINETYESGFITKSGNYIWANISTNPILAEDRSYAGALFMMTDITVRKKTEQEMLWLINNTEECFILLNHDLKIVSFNNQFKLLYARYLGINVDKGDSILDYAQPERLEALKEVYKRVLRGSEEYAEITIPLPSATEKNFAIKYKPAKNEQYETIGVFVSVIDITEKRKAEAQKEFERRDKEALINTTEDLIWSVNKDFRLIAANHAFINTLKEATGASLKTGDELLQGSMYPAESLALWLGLYNKALNGESFIKEIYSPAWRNKPEFWAETRFNPIYDGSIITGVACYTRDTTSSRSFKNKLIDINKKLETAQQTAKLGYWELSMDQATLYWSDEVYKIWGVSAEAFQTNYERFHSSIHPDDREMFDTGQKNAFEGEGKLDVEHRIILADGTIKFVHEKGELDYDDQGIPIHFEGTVQDITERKKTEAILIKRDNQLTLASEMAKLGYWEFDIINDLFTFSDQFYAIFKTTAEKVGGYTMSSARYAELFIHPGDRDIVAKSIEKAIGSKNPSFSFKGEHRIVYATGELGYISVHFYIVKDENGRTIRNFGVNQDITERKKTESGMKDITNRLLMATNSANMGIWDWDILKNHLQWDEGMHLLYKINNLEFRSVYDCWISRLHPEDRMRVNEEIQMAVTGKKLYNTEFRIVWGDLSVHYIKATGMIEKNQAGNAIRMIGLNWDITELKLSEIRLSELNVNNQKNAKKLAESNAELEQFAYVASHDLQEPLRMVTSYLTQIEKKYGNIIDDKGRKYIHFAVDGARRMRQIILDLLEFSRLGRTDESIEDIDLNELIHEIQILFIKQIKEKKATIIFNNFPRVHAHRSPLRQVFQNLISNALKYNRKDISVRIHITAEEFTNYWQFSVADNGIGIEKEYFDKIFVIFQRLHNKDEFSGTGIGLAVTKKIIENMGGKIWLKSTPGEGSTFYFTILSNLKN
jgi:PAS domain S-box-containing protein